MVPKESGKMTDSLVDEILALKAQGHTLRQIGGKVGLSYVHVRRVLLNPDYYRSSFQPQRYKVFTQVQWS